jgi:hypothetical protein
MEAVPMFLRNVGIYLRVYTTSQPRRTKMAVFWVVAPCSLVELYQRFRGPCCLHHQGDLIALMMEAATQKTAIFILTAVKTSNPTQKNNFVNM